MSRVLRSDDDLSSDHGLLLRPGEHRVMRYFGLASSHSRRMQAVFSWVKQNAGSAGAALIAGEPGTGKGVVADAMHTYSLRRHQPFVRINLRALPPESVEQEFFGSPVSGVTRMSRTPFERAHLGTLYINGFDLIPQALQERILATACGPAQRNIETEGSSLDVRLIISTDCKLEKVVASGKLCDSAIAATNNRRIEVPSLDQRREDLPDLIEHMLGLLNHQTGERKYWNRDVIRVLSQQQWPGNLSQLERVLAEIYRLSSEIIHLSDIPDHVFADTEKREHRKELRIPVGTTIAEAEKALILATLKMTDGHRSQAANTLGISVKTLYNKLRDYGLLIKY